MKLVLGFLFVLAVTACSSAPPAQDVHNLSGMDLYERLCSSCHGATGHGDGPVASLIASGVPDLTLMARRDGGEFPTEDVRYTIDGRWDRRAHGSRDMPVWGWRLYDISGQGDEAARAEVDSTIDRLVGYLQSIQVR